MAPEKPASTSSIVRDLQYGWWIHARPNYPNRALRSAPSHASGDLRQETPYHGSLGCNTGDLSSLETWQGVNCRTGAETSNVKDEPRRDWARLVQHAGVWSEVYGEKNRVARGVTNPAVGSGALLDGSSLRLAAIKVRTGSGKSQR